MTFVYNGNGPNAFGMMVGGAVALFILGKVFLRARRSKFSMLGFQLGATLDRPLDELRFRSGYRREQIVHFYQMQSFEGSVVIAIKWAQASAIGHGETTRMEFRLDPAQATEFAAMLRDASGLGDRDSAR